MATTASEAVVPDQGVRSLVMDEAAFACFYRRTARPLRGYLLRCLGDPAMADDLLQEAYLRLLRSDFETDDEQHRKNYLFRIATNLVRDHFRRRKPEDPLADDAGRSRPGHHGVDLRTDVSRALAGLAPRDRQMLWLAYVEGSSHAEIAGALGLKTASLKSMLFRARSRLAAKLSKLGLQPMGREDA
jgi:RNA polymerase sigma-70 factor (ECF subfamily)